jgi:hypothetical protein
MNAEAPHGGSLAAHLLRNHPVYGVEPTRIFVYSVPRFLQISCRRLPDHISMLYRRMTP